MVWQSRYWPGDDGGYQPEYHYPVLTGRLSATARDRPPVPHAQGAGGRRAAGEARRASWCHSMGTSTECREALVCRSRRAPQILAATALDDLGAVSEFAILRRSLAGGSDTAVTPNRARSCIAAA